MKNKKLRAQAAGGDSLCVRVVGVEVGLGGRGWVPTAMLCSSSTPPRIYLDVAIPVVGSTMIK